MNDNPEEVTEEQAPAEKEEVVEKIEQEESCITAEEFAELKRKAKEHDKWLAVAQQKTADFENLRRRTSQQIQDAHKYGSENLIKKLLPVLDIFEQALKAENCQDIEQLREGIEQVGQLLRKTLKEEGLEQIDALAKEMNPDYHEVLLTEATEDDDKHDTVVEVFRTGYTLKDRVLRASQVKVAKKMEN